MSTSIRSLRSRIRSVSSTKQITRAMQMVAASKMRRAEEADSASAPYVDSASEILTYLASQGATQDHPMFAKRPVKSRLIILVAADKGLAGAYNNNLMKRYVEELKKDDAEKIKNSTITVGRRAAQFATRLKDTAVIAVYQDLPDRPAGNELRAILDTAVSKFISGEVDDVDVIYTAFNSTIAQEVNLIHLLPAGFTETPVSDEVREAKYEPNVQEVLNSVVYRIVGAQLFQALLDARASEYAMRMMAMKNATDNADGLVDDLTLEMNKARQGAITQELAEISGGVEAMK